jgi:hypothetical protein
MTLESLYERYQDEDGFLYIQYTNLSFKAIYSFNQRQQEFHRITAKYPDKIPGMNIIILYYI